MAIRYVIVGNGAAGISACEAIRSVDRDGEITLIADEPYMAYSKVLLHYYIGSQIDEKGLFIRSEKFYKTLGVNTVFGSRVEKISLQENAIFLSDTSKIHFGKLLIASGASPIRPRIKQVDQSDIHTMWTLTDAKKIRQRLCGCRDAIVVGASFVGMQAVDSLHKCGISVNVVDVADRILPNILDAKGSDVLKKHLGQMHRVRCFLSALPMEIRGAGADRKILVLKGNQTVEGDLCIIATGARPNIDFLSDSMLETRIGLVVDGKMRTNFHHVFAAGDVAEVPDFITGERKIFGLWTAAVEQGKIAGLNMAGKNVVYPGGVDMNIIGILGFPVLAVGKTTADTPDDGISTFMFYNKQGRSYRKFFVKDDVLIGAILLGDVRDGGLIGGLIHSRTKMDTNRLFSVGKLRYRLNSLPCRCR